jgi:5-methyltetrahydrofolate--homocysteine methyltransferase
VVHVLDASRVVGAANGLLGSDREKYIAELKVQQEKTRNDYLNRVETRKLATIENARARKTKVDWPEEYKKEKIKKPNFIGIKTFENITLAELVPYIDWTPFFHTWQIKGTYPRLLTDETYGKQATELFNDAQKLLKDIVAKNTFKTKAVVGIFPANSIGDDIEIYSDETRKKVLTVFHTIRQQVEPNQTEKPLQALSDFIAPKESTVTDYLGAFAVTTGHGVEEFAKIFENKNDDYNSIMAKALADRFAEAFAEYMHAKVRKEIWGYAADEKITIDEMIHEKYQGIRPAPGYPAQPDHTEKPTLWKLLDVEKNTGIKLTESYAMWPASSVSGLYFASPHANYFSVAKIGEDQLIDYAKRKNMDVDLMKKWLSPILDY